MADPEAKERHKTLLCLTALCLTQTQWSQDFLTAVGLVLEISDDDVGSARTLLYSPPRVHQQQQKSTDDNTSMLDYAEAMAAGFRCRWTPEIAVQAWIRMLWITLRDGQELAATLSRLHKKRERQLLERTLHYDGRTSVVLRRLALLLRLRLPAVAALEEQALRQLQLAALAATTTTAAGQDGNPTTTDDNGTRDETTSSTSQNPQDKKGKQRWIRAAKIGAAATAAGGLLFVTGGLAAPALAAGLSTLGLASVATLATTTTVATLLGAGGAGLAGYKMTRRTAGLQQFEFQKITNHGSSNHPEDDDDKAADDTEEIKGMTVYVCVSGYLRQPGPAAPQKPTNKESTTDASATASSPSNRAQDLLQKSSSFLKESTQRLTNSPPKDGATSPDFYGPWGVEPPHMLPSHLVERFYSVVDPEKVKLARHLVEAFPGQEEDVMNRLADIYGVHPRDMQPPEAQLEHHNGEATELYAPLLNHVASLAKKNNASSSSTTTNPKEKKKLFGKKKNTTDNEPPPPPTEFDFSETLLNHLVDSDKPWGDEYHVEKKSEEDETMTISESSSEFLDVEEVKKTFEEAAAHDKEEKKDDNNNNEKAMQDNKEESLDEQTRKTLEDEIKLLDIGHIAEDEETSADDGTLAKKSEEEEKEEKQQEQAGDEVYWWRQSVAHFGDQYTVIYDPQKLLDVAKCFQNLIAEGVNKGVQQGLKFTALSAVMTAVTFPLAIMSVLNNLDESWAMACEAADEAGVLMAEALMAESSGNRPVVLIGYSAGGRVVTSCLTELAKIAWGLDKKSKKNSKKGKTDEDDMDDDDNSPAAKIANSNAEFLTDFIENDKTINEKERHRRLRAATIVRDAILIGVPAATTPVDKWRLRRSVVQGRFVNAYCEKDWVLSILYRYKRKTVVSLAGLGPVALQATDEKSMTGTFYVSPMENVSVSKLVKHHGDYPSRIKGILELVGVGDVDGEAFHSNYFA